MNRCMELNEAYVKPAKRPIPILNREFGPRNGFRAPKKPNANPPVVKRRIFLNTRRHDDEKRIGEIWGKKRTCMSTT